MPSLIRRLRELFCAMREIAATYGQGSRVRLWLKMIMTVMQPRLPRMTQKAQRLDLQLEGKHFSIWMLDRTGLAAFEEVFIRGEYFVPDIPAPRTILDVGANIGVASIYFCLKYPGARLFAIEPNPDVCEILRKNLAQFPNTTVHECALSDTDGVIDFHIHPTSSIASSIQSRVSGGKIVQVPSKRLDSFMKYEKFSALDLLKFDIEGAEDRMLRSIRDMRVVRNYVGEIHPDLMNASLHDITSLFAGFTVRTSPLGEKRFLLTAIAKG